MGVQVSSALDPYGSQGNVWVELTRSEHHHGGAGWEFGTCLWSPSVDKAGHDRYAIMRQPMAGDLVLHIYHDTWNGAVAESRLCGSSRVKAQHRAVREEPPAPGEWSGAPSYYRVDLEAYQPFPHPLPLSSLAEYYGDLIRDEIVQEQPHHYPFSTYGSGIRLAQGMYLARCTEQLYQILRTALGLASATAEADSVTMQPHVDFAEGQRMAKERYFFARNPHLAKRAKERYGYVCQVCAFDFLAVYGELGRGYIECHHLNPLSERPEQEWTEKIRTSLDDVAVLCANCHCMAHRRRPAVTLSELRASIAGVTS
jgi:hypothetical protein